MLAFVFFGLCASRSSLGLAASRLASPRLSLSASPFASSASRPAKLEDISTNRRPFKLPRPLGVAPRPGRGSPHEAPRLRAAASEAPRLRAAASRPDERPALAARRVRQKETAGPPALSARLQRARYRTSTRAQLPGLRDTLSFPDFTTRSASRTPRVPRTTASSATCFSTRSSTRSTSRTTSVSNDRLSAVPPLAVRGRNVVNVS